MRISTLITIVVTTLVCGCGGPDPAVVSEVQAAEGRLQQALSKLRAGEFSSVAATWTADSVILTKHADVVIEGGVVRMRLERLAQQYRSALDQGAAGWVANVDMSADAWSALVTLSAATGSQTILHEQKRREQARAAEKAAQEAEAKRQEKIQAAAVLDQRMAVLPRSVVVRVRRSEDLPQAISKRHDRLVAAVVGELQSRLAGIPVQCLDKDYPLGAEGCAGCLVDVLITCEYASYAQTGQAMLGLSVDSVPSRLIVQVTSRPGLAFDLGLATVSEATKETPQALAHSEIGSLADRQGETLVMQVLADLPEKIPTFDVPALVAKGSGLTVDCAKAPLFLLETATKAGKRPKRGIEVQNTAAEVPLMPSGVGEMNRDIITQIARRLAPVRFTTDRTAQVDGRIGVQTTLWFTDYGRKLGALQTNNGSIPYRAETVISLTTATDAWHPWSGTHLYCAATGLADKVDTSGGFTVEATRAVKDMSDQIAQQIDAELALSRTYQQPAAGDVDQYLLIVVPVGSLALADSDSLPILAKLPALLVSAVSAKVAPATLVAVSQMQPGRVAGLLTVQVDGAIASYTEPGGSKAEAIPHTLTLELQLSSAFSRVKHTWEGQHSIAVTVDLAHVGQPRVRGIQDVVAASLAKELKNALK